MAQKSDPNTEWLFGGEDDRTAWEAHRRFISPLFNGIYRQSVIGPSHLPEAEFAAFLSEARTDVGAASARLLAWVKKDRAPGGDFGDLAIDRLIARADELDAESALGLVAVFAATMDEYYRLRPKTVMFIDTWEKSETILRTLNRSVDGFDLSSVAEDIASRYASLSWMSNSIGRRDLWAHGLAGDRPRDAGERLLGEPELKAFLSTLLARITKLDKESILALPNLLGVLLTFVESPWHKAGIKTVIRRFTGARSSDMDFVRFMDATAGTIISSDRGVVRHISMSTLAEVIGAAAFDKRWASLLSNSHPPHLEDQIVKIKRMIAESKNW